MKHFHTVKKNPYSFLFKIAQKVSIVGIVYDEKQSLITVMNYVNKTLSLRLYYDLIVFILSLSLMKLLTFVIMAIFQFIHSGSKSDT